jgi:ribosomal protein S18 acetylase RimI-like enzyme
MHYVRMSKNLQEPLQLPTWPGGVMSSTVEDTDAAEAHQLLVLAYAEGGCTVPPVETWWATLTGDAEFDPKLCFLVRNSAGQLIALAQCWTSAFIKDLVVHPGHRRQGLGKALLLHVFSSFKVRSVTTVTLKVQTANVVAMQLYGQIGMEVEVCR